MRASFHRRPHGILRVFRHHLLKGGMAIVIIFCIGAAMTATGRKRAAKPNGTNATHLHQNSQLLK